MACVYFVVGRFAAGWQPVGRAVRRRVAVGPRVAATTLSAPVEEKKEGVVAATWEKEASSSSEELGLLSFASARTVGERMRSTSSVRMRFAPSPTGSLHVGGARTALYNWLAARKTGGQFLIRIEDTDVARSTRESEESMLADLEWLGLEWDEGPRVGGPCGLYRQSERGSVYAEAARALVEEGKAYPCFCSEEELEAKRQAAKADGKQVAYDGTWRDADPAEVQRRLANGDPHTIRFKTPKNCVLSIEDQIRGHISWDVEATIGDFILVRSSGVPVYNFVVAVDDATMGVTTVVRAEEHLTNTVRQLLVLDGLGFPEPRYAHASLILGSDKSKLSKRHGATSCGQFKDQGYLADAMINYLALLGWNDGTDKELYSREELIDAFDIERVIPSPAMFDENKLKWLNGQHLRAMKVHDLADIALDFFRKADILPTTDETLSSSEEKASSPLRRFVVAATEMAQPKAELVTDVASVVRDCLLYPLDATLEKSGDKKLKQVLDDDFPAFARAVADSFDNKEAPAWCYKDDVEEEEASSAEVKAWIDSLGVKTGKAKKKLFMAARLALTGRLAGPDVASQLRTVALAHQAGLVANVVPVADRIDQLRDWVRPEEENPPSPPPLGDGGSSLEGGAAAASAGTNPGPTTTEVSHLTNVFHE